MNRTDERDDDTSEVLESTLLVVILLLVGGFAGAASFTHVKDWTLTNSPAGTAEWFGWGNAVISELVPIACALVIRRRRRAGQPFGYPLALLVCAAGLSLSAQLAVAKPGPSGWLLSAVPALAFMALVKLVLSTPVAPAQMTESSAHAPPAVPQVARTPELDTPPAPQLDTPTGPELDTPTIADLATLATTIPAPRAGGSNGTGWPPTTGVNGHQLATLTRPPARVAKQPARGGSNKVSNRGGPGRKPAGQQGVKESKAARQKRVAKLLAADPDAGAKKVANQLGIPVSTARNDLTELRAPKES